jgi:hypothetical protein
VGELGASCVLCFWDGWTLLSKVSESRTACTAVLILALALGIRLAAASGWQARLADERAFAFGDSGSYWVLAQRWVRGETYRYGIDQSCAFRTPGYPLMLAALLWLVGDDPPVLVGRWLGCVCGTVAVGLVMRLGLQLFDRTTACVAGLLTSLLPDAVGMSIWVLSEAPFVPCMLGQLSCWIAAERAGSGRGWWSWMILAGIANGFAILMRPSWLLFVPMVAGLSAVLGCFGLLGVWAPTGRRAAAVGQPSSPAGPPVRQDGDGTEADLFKLTSEQLGHGRWKSPSPLLAQQSSRILATASGMLLVTGLVLLPWWIWTYRQTGTWVVTTLQTGASLYDGWRPGADGGSDMRFVEPMFRSLLAQEAVSPPPAGSPPLEVRFDRYLHAQAVAWAKAHPNEVVRLMGIKFMRMWSPWPHAAELQSWPVRATVLVGYVPVLMAALWGVSITWRRGWNYWLCWLPAIYFTGLHLIFASSIRYRQPAMVCLVVLAAATLSQLYQRRLEGRLDAPRDRLSG